MVLQGGVSTEDPGMLLGSTGDRPYDFTDFSDAQNFALANNIPYIQQQNAYAFGPGFGGGAPQPYITGNAATGGTLPANPGEVSYQVNVQGTDPALQQALQGGYGTPSATAVNLGGGGGGSLGTPLIPPSPLPFVPPASINTPNMFAPVPTMGSGPSATAAYSPQATGPSGTAPSINIPGSSRPMMPMMTPQQQAPGQPMQPAPTGTPSGGGGGTAPGPGPARGSTVAPQAGPPGAPQQAAFGGSPLLKGSVSYNQPLGQPPSGGILSQLGNAAGNAIGGLGNALGSLFMQPAYAKEGLPKGYVPPAPPAQANAPSMSQLQQQAYSQYADVANRHAQAAANVPSDQDVRARFSMPKYEAMKKSQDLANQIASQVSAKGKSPNQFLDAVDAAIEKAREGVAALWGVPKADALKTYGQFDEKPKGAPSLNEIMATSMRAANKDQNEAEDMLRGDEVTKDDEGNEVAPLLDRMAKRATDQQMAMAHPHESFMTKMGHALTATSISNRTQEYHDGYIANYNAARQQQMQKFELWQKAADSRMAWANNMNQFKKSLVDQMAAIEQGRTMSEYHAQATVLEHARMELLASGQSNQYNMEEANLALIQKEVDLQDDMKRDVMKQNQDNKAMKTVLDNQKAFSTYLDQMSKIQVLESNTASFRGLTDQAGKIFASAYQAQIKAEPGDSDKALKAAQQASNTFMAQAQSQLQKMSANAGQ